MKLSSLKVDADLAKTGQKFEFGEPDEKGRTAWFQIGYIENRATKLQKLMRKAAQKLPLGKTVSDEVAEQVTRESMVGTVLLAFGNIFNDDDTEMQVNEKTLLEILKTPACFAFIAQRANELSNFQREKEEVAQADTKSGAGLEPSVLGTPARVPDLAGGGDGGSGFEKPPGTQP